MHNFPPNLNPEAYTITALIVGLIIEDDFTANELNSIGNWLILVGQLTLTTAAQQQLINNRFQHNTGSRIKSDSNNHAAANPEFATRASIEALYRKVEQLEQLFYASKK